MANEKKVSIICNTCNRALVRVVDESEVKTTIVEIVNGEKHFGHDVVDYKILGYANPVDQRQS